MRKRLPVPLVGGLVLLCLSLPFARAQTKPVVVSTNPANGATGVDPYLASFSITFSKPMDTTRCGASTRSWPYPPSGQGGSCTWSADKLTMTLTRYNAGTPLGTGIKIEAYLVDPEWKESYLVDAEGNHVDPYYYSFTIAAMPTVISTNPPDGATNVPAYLDSISITFSKPMDKTRCGASTNWPYQDGGSCTWSADGRTMTLTRYNEFAIQKVVVYLNLPDTTPVLRDADGINLWVYSFSFSLNSGSGTKLKIPADSQKGFEWPYYLYVPKSVKTPTVLLVEPNNSGHTSVDPAFDDYSASELVDLFKFRGDDVGSPYLVPTFPRPMANWEVYTQSLDRDTLTTSLPGLVRIDLQLIAMIDDARTRLTAMGINAGPKVWMIGYSASGAFANRFALLHPDRIQAVSAGSGNGYATAPVAAWKGKTLPYPVGIADLQQLVGRPFDTAAFSKVPIQIYIGDRDGGKVDEFFIGGAFSAEDVALIQGVFGEPALNRYPASEAVYKSIGSNCQFIIFPGMPHLWPDWGFIREFLERNRTEPYPPPLPTPLLYTLYFPHVASYGSWETEIALTSTAEVPVHCELRAMAAEGGNPIETMPVTIPAGGRVELTAGKSFKDPQNVAYIAVVSNSGFLAGYTRFTQPGNRTSLPLAGGATEGYFTKVETDGYTGIALVNVETALANISLLAYDDNGTPVASQGLQLEPGRKYVRLLDEIFAGADLPRLRYVKFSSDKKLAGFTVSGSSDGQMLDGLQALGTYIPQR